jgi:PadR family transcriptional regulator, regulatory protein PadR
MAPTKDLTAASATPMVLGIIAAGDSYGYEIIKNVKTLSGGALEWSEGMLYPVLHRLEEGGLAESYWSGDERPRKYYRITEAGRLALAELRSQWEKVASAMARCFAAAGDGKE